MPVVTRDPNEWRIPPKEAAEDDIVAWISDAVERSDTFLKSQRAYNGIDQGVEFIAGPSNEELPESYSKVSVNRGKRQIREFVSTFANMRPVSGVTSDDKDLASQVEVHNKMRKAWYGETFADRSYRKMYQVGAVKGTAYIRPYWDEDFHGPGRGDIALYVHNPEDVFPIQVGEDGDIDKAYAVTIRFRMPVSQACEKFPTKQHLITADRQSPSGMRGVLSRIKQRFASPALNVRGTGRGERAEPSIFPECDIYLTYVRDKRVNMGSTVMAMGKPGSKSYYEVPFAGQDLPTGIKDDKGRELTRKATREDCLVYPRLRVLWSTNNHLLDDGPNPEWYPKVPLVKYQVDDWPWEFLGYGLARDIQPMQDSARRILRAIDDAVNAQLNPTLVHDEQTVSKTLMDEFDPRQPGQTVGINMQMGEGIKPLLPPDYYKVQPEAIAMIDKYWQWMDHQLGTPEVSAMARLKQMPASDSIEKILEAGGPLINDIAREIERVTRKEGEIWLALSWQHYDTKRKVLVLGDEGMTKQDYDYDPGNAVPSHFPGEDVTKISRGNIYDRAKFYMNRTRYQTTENSILQIKMMSRRIYLLQLQKLQYPIDPWTIAEASDLNNFGPPPKGANTIMERWVAWQHMQTELKVSLQKQLQEAGVGAPAGKGQRGRPASGDATKIEQKDGGTRSTMTS